MKLWTKATARPVSAVKLEAKDYEEYVATLRRLNAPERLIRIAQEVAAAHADVPSATAKE